MSALLAFYTAPAPAPLSAPAQVTALVSMPAPTPAPCTCANTKRCANCAVSFTGFYMIDIASAISPAVPSAAAAITDPITTSAIPTTRYTPTTYWPPYKACPTGLLYQVRDEGTITLLGKGWGRMGSVEIVDGRTSLMIYSAAVHRSHSEV